MGWLVSRRERERERGRERDGELGVYIRKLEKKIEGNSDL